MPNLRKLPDVMEIIQSKKLSVRAIKMKKI